MKKVAYALYVHKSNIEELYSSVAKEDQDYIKACINLVGKFDYAIVKFAKDTGNVSLIASHDWDTANEPTVGDSYCFNRTLNNIKIIKSNGKIYHNKWQFVASDYKGFDIEEAKQRSALWNACEEIKKNKSRIGNRNYWNDVLARNNIPI